MGTCISKKVISGMSVSIPVKERALPLWQNIHSWFARQLDDHKPKGTIAPLDGVRALAFLTVLMLHVGIMAFHLGLWQRSDNPFESAFLSSGGAGVTLFFVLSGFLLFLPYSQALLLKKTWPDAKIFYMRRIFRIFPAYFFSLFILVMFSKPSLLQPHNWIRLIPFFTFTMGVSNASLINGPYWTLAVEFQYYLLLPLIALGIYGLTRLAHPERRLLVIVGCLLVMIFWGVGTRYLGGYFTAHPGATVLVPRSFLDKLLFVIYGDNGKFFEDFAVGMLIAVCYIFITNSPQREHYLCVMQRLAPLLFGASLVIYSFAAMRTYTAQFNYTWSFAPRLFAIYPWTTELIYALGYGCLVLAVLFNRPGGLIVRFFAWTPLRWIGLISYSLYIWHVPLLFALQANIGPSVARLNHSVAVVLCGVIVLGVSVFFCFFTYILVERPGMRLSERLRQQMLLQQVKRQSAVDRIDIPESTNQPAPVGVASQGNQDARL